MEIRETLTDETVLIEFGQRISSRRIGLNMTQATLAKNAGLSKRTIERIEDGASAQILSIIKILRVLGLLNNLDQLIPESTPEPMELLKRKRKLRIRASKKKPESAPATSWQWKEDQ